MTRVREKTPRGEMPFLDHLEELRWRIFKAAGSLVIGAVAGFWLIQRFEVLELLIAPVVQYLPDGKLNVFNPVTPFFFLLKTSVLIGIVLALPIIVYQIWAFLSPALEKREKQLVVPGLYGGFVLFAAGVWLAYRFALPVSLRFLFSIQSDLLVATLGADEYLSFVVRLLVAFGVIFELPVVVLILSVMGLVTPAFLRSKRRHAIVIITIVASLLSPGDVLVVTAIMMAPLILLYELSIWISVFVHRRRRDVPEPTIRAPEPPSTSVSLGDDEDGGDDAGDDEGDR
ncbi:MAG: twin-arginine translocase subunit TatC [Longimicrobiales bacterium]|nr:twin-arginine translocase subunit TatC [Longimicrobiales bacterium]